MIIIKNGITFTLIREPQLRPDNTLSPIFTTACFDLLLKKYDIRNNKEYCVALENGKTCVYKYSGKLITYFISLIADDKDIVVKFNKKS